LLEVGVFGDPETVTVSVVVRCDDNGGGCMWKKEDEL
jgi:hypothetical protein